MEGLVTASLPGETNQVLTMVSWVITPHPHAKSKPGLCPPVKTARKAAWNVRAQPLGRQNPGG